MISNVYVTFVVVWLPGYGYHPIRIQFHGLISVNTGRLTKLFHKTYKMKESTEYDMAS